MDNKVRNYKLKQIFAMMKRIGLSHAMRFDLIKQATGRLKGLGGFSSCTDADLHKVIAYLASHPTQLVAKASWSKGNDAANEAAQRMRRKIIAMAYDMKWQLPSGKCDMARIDNWCSNYGKFKKKLNDHTEAELIIVISQFEIVVKDFIRSLRK